MDLMVLGIFASVTVLSLANTVILYLESPHGQWDAWMIWNLRARFLFKGPGFWEQFSDAASAFSHYDYPLMIPVSVARLWYFTGGSITIAPMLLASLFTYAAAGLLLCVTWKVRGRTNALLAAATLLGTRHFVFSGASQQADVALAFFFLATICLFLLNDAVGESGGGLLMLAGASAGLALWTKNEGWLFLLAVAAARITATVAMSGRRRCLKELACFGLGLCPALGVAVIQKIQFASSNDLISGDRINIILPLLADPFRYLQILKEFAGQLFVFHRWGYVAPVLLIYPCLVGVHVEGDQRKSLLFGAATLGLMLVGYFFVYVITPHDLLWHLRHSLDRLFIQLWPSFLLIFFGLVVGPRGSERG
jgi:4-amino-4-deoxy-L-arabinose transferase-like glycosyltransferase